MHRIAWLLAVVVLAAGCAGPTEEAPEPLDGTPEPPDDPPEQVVYEAPAAPPLNVTADVGANRTVFGYAVHGPEGPTAFRLRVDVGADNECMFITQATGVSSGEGHSILSIREADGRHGYSYFSSGNGVVTVGVGEESASALGGGGEFWARSWSRGGWSGVVTTTVLVPHLAPVHFDGAPDTPLRVEVECKKPFDVLDAHHGTEVALFSKNNLSGGARAEAPTAGGATVLGTGTLDVTAPTGRVLALRGGYETGLVEVTNPEGSTASLGPTSTAGRVSVEGGPGTYTVEATEGGAFIDLFAAAIFGFQGPVDLSQGSYDERVLEDP